MEVKKDEGVCVDEWTAGNRREERCPNLRMIKERTHTVVAVYVVEICG